MTKSDLAATFGRPLSFLVTGGTGYFGRAFVRHLLVNSLSDRICIYSRDEAKQAWMRTQFSNDERLRWFIGDVRDRDRLAWAMGGVGRTPAVDVVIHAAALKRIEVGAYNPSEMIKTNVDGSMNVVHAAIQAGVNRVVGLSTDKAFQPISAYGQSKALMESLFVAANNTVGQGGPLFSVTRYGNVWNSTGSVVPTWVDLLRRGINELPVTDLEATRFYMSAQEAVDLVLDVVNRMKGGEIAIRNDLPAYRVGDRIAALRDVKPIIRGLPEHEKLHEAMDADCTSDKARRLSVDFLYGQLAIAAGVKPRSAVAAA